MIHISRPRYYVIAVFALLALVSLPAGGAMLIFPSSSQSGVILLIAAFGFAVCGLVVTLSSPRSSHPIVGAYQAPGPSGLGKAEAADPK